MSGYIGVQPVPQATQRREYFTATSGQTTFNTNGYTPGYIDVFMNGVKLSPSDFTATNGSDVVLASGATTGDLLQVISFTPFNVANQTFVGNVNLSSGAYQIGGNTVIDSSRNVSAAAGTFTGTLLGAAATFSGNLAIKNGSPQMFFGTTSANHYNWMIAAQENIDAAFEISVGSQDNDFGDDTYTQLVTVKNTGDVNITSGKLQMNGSTTILNNRQGRFNEGTFAGTGTEPTSGIGQLALHRSNGNPFLSFHGTDGARTGYLQQIDGGDMWLSTEDGGQWKFYNGTDTVFRVSNNGDTSIGGGTTQTWAQLAIRKANDAAGIALESGASNGLTYEIQSGPSGNFLFYDRSNSRYLYSGYNYQHDWYVSSQVAMRLNSDGLQVSTGGLGITSGTKTYRNEINNSSTSFSATGTLKINTALNGSGEGVLISSETRTTNDNGTSMFRLIDRAGDESFRSQVNGTSFFNKQLNTAELVGPGRGRITQKGYAISANTEENHNHHPDLHNMIAHAHARGNVTATIDGSSWDMGNNPFNTGSKFASYSAGSGDVVITVTNYETLSYGRYAGVHFGNSGWAPNSVKIEEQVAGTWHTIYTHTDGPTASHWAQGYNSAGHPSHYRFTFSRERTVRITSLFAYNYNSPGSSSYHVSRSGHGLFDDLIIPSGKGINFYNYGTGVGSNTLDDYEEGTFAPMTSTLANVYHARYTKIGNLVTINCSFNMKSGQSRNFISLPFTPNNDGAGGNTSDSVNNRYAGTVAYFTPSGGSAPLGIELWHQGNQGANAYFIAKSATNTQTWPYSVSDSLGVIGVSFTYQTSS